MGFPEYKEQKQPPPTEGPSEPREINWKPGRWGDTKVGKWNGGVNAEEGLGDGVERGWDVVELGAGCVMFAAWFGLEAHVPAVRCARQRTFSKLSQQMSRPPNPHRSGTTH